MVKRHIFSIFKRTTGFFRENRGKNFWNKKIKVESDCELTEYHI